MDKLQKKSLIGLLILALLSPLGVILPKLFDGGDAWGEWDSEAIEKLIGYVPEGMKHLSELWKAPVADYNFFGEGGGTAREIVSYIGSGILGVAILLLIFFIISKFLKKSDNKK